MSAASHALSLDVLRLKIRPRSPNLHWRTYHESYLCPPDIPGLLTAGDDRNAIHRLLARSKRAQTKIFREWHALLRQGQIPRGCHSVFQCLASRLPVCPGPLPTRRDLSQAPRLESRLSGTVTVGRTGSRQLSGSGGSGQPADFHAELEAGPAVPRCAEG